MVALRFSVLALFFLCACAQSQQALKVKSLVDGCFTVGRITLDETNEPVLATASINSSTATADCPCKSAVMAYTVSQKKDGNTFTLISGQFSALGKTSIDFPIAVQKQLVFPNTPILIAFACADN